MRISTKVEFGIIALLDIALNTNNESTVKVNAISKRNNTSAVEAVQSYKQRQGVKRWLQDTAGAWGYYSV